MRLIFAAAACLYAGSALAEFEDAYYVDEQYVGGYHVCHYRALGGMHFTINSRRDCELQVSFDAETNAVRRKE